MSELKRAFSWDAEGKPVMVIYKEQTQRTTYHAKRREIEGYVIDLNDAHLFSRDHYPTIVKCFYGFNSAGVPIVADQQLTYDEAMFAKCSELCHQFDLGLVTSRKMADIASLIEEGIDELVKMPPHAEREKYAIGEAKITITGNDGGKVEKIIDITA